MRSEERLRRLLREAPLPGAAEAERRGLLVVAEAFAGRERTRRSPAPRLAVVLASMLALAALVLSPAGASVRGWVDDVFTTGTPPPAPALTDLPGGGRLLVQSEEGTWVVQADGSRRLLGRYEEASWSPHGLFVAAASGHTLSAIEPDGTVHWALSAPGVVSDPRWSPSGVRIAYRSGQGLRVVDADGEDDRAVAARVAPVPPAWFGPGLHYLAFVGADGRLRVEDVDGRRRPGSAPALAGIETLAWSADGSTLLEASPHALRVRAVETSKLAGSIRLGASRPIPLPSEASPAAAAFSGQGTAIAAVLRFDGGGDRPPRSEVALLDPAGGRPNRLLSVPGDLASVLWSPDDSRLLIPWPGLDQWLFIPAGGRGKERAFGPISQEFAPGAAAAGTGFPSVEGWCCATRGAAGPG